MSCDRQWPNCESLKARFDARVSSRACVNAQFDSAADLCSAIVAVTTPEDRFVISGKLFTRDYLFEAIMRSEQWKSLTEKDFKAVKNRLHTLVTTFAKNTKANEAETERDLIYPVFEALGWSDISVQPNLSTKCRKQIPDALLLADAEHKARAVAEPEQWKRYQHGLAILESKRWQRPLDRNVGGDESAPATQILQYLSRVDVQTTG